MNPLFDTESQPVDWSGASGNLQIHPDEDSGDVIARLTVDVLRLRAIKASLTKARSAFSSRGRDTLDPRVVETAKSSWRFMDRMRWQFDSARKSRLRVREAQDRRDKADQKLAQARRERLYKFQLHGENPFNSFNTIKGEGPSEESEELASSFSDRERSPLLNCLESWRKITLKGTPEFRLTDKAVDPRSALVTAFLSIDMSGYDLSPERLAQVTVDDHGGDTSMIADGQIQSTTYRVGGIPIKASVDPETKQTTYTWVMSPATPGRARQLQGIVSD